MNLAVQVALINMTWSRRKTSGVPTITLIVIVCFSVSTNLDVIGIGNERGHAFDLVKSNAGKVRRWGSTENCSVIRRLVESWYKLQLDLVKTSVYFDRALQATEVTYTECGHIYCSQFRYCPPLLPVSHCESSSLV